MITLITIILINIKYIALLLTRLQSASQKRKNIGKNSTYKNKTDEKSR